MFNSIIPSLSLLALCLVLIFYPQNATCQLVPPVFKCTTKPTCQALVGYTPKNKTTLAHILSLFQPSSLLSLLGPNNLPPSTPPNHVVAANQTVRIPFPCRCINGSGISDRVPVYTVVKNDWLSTIANQIFGGLMTYQQIQAVNKIRDANLIYADQKLWIPLPCSCDDMEGEIVVHYGHVVAEGSSFQAIAKEFGTTSESLKSLNGFDDTKKLIAGQVLDVPLKACSSSVQKSSPDYPLLVANNSYVVTANNCMMCNCNSTANFTLQCQESGLKPVNWAKCPTVPQCSGNLSLGDSTTSNCGHSTCAYSGYNDNAILTSLTCPAPASPSGGQNGASRINLRGWSLPSALLCVQLLMLHRFM